MSGRGLELRVLSGIGDIFSLHGVEKLSVLGLVQLVGREVEIGVSCDLRYGQADRVSCLHHWQVVEHGPTHIVQFTLSDDKRLL